MTTAITDGATLLEAYFDPAHRADPFPLLRQIREASPLVLRGDDLVVVARYDDCRQVLRDPSVRNEPRLSRLGAAQPEQARSLLFLDPPAHTRIRRLVSKAFTPRVVTGLVPRIRALTDALIDALADRPDFDAVADFASPLPMQIICELLGIPVEDYHSFEPVAHRFGRGLDFDLIIPNPDLDDSQEAREFLFGYLRDLIARRRREPGTDLLSRMIAVEEQGDVLTEAELLATSALLMGAGYDTTVNLISGSLLALLRDPAALARLRAEPQLATGIADEALRFCSPAQFVMRTATEPLRVGDVDITPGTLVLCLLAAANRDPARYPDPDRFDLDRAPTDHVAFSAGIHFCIAAALARAEAAVAMTAFAERVVGPEIVAEPTWRDNINLRGLRSLPARHAGIVAPRIGH
ncbi:cytochrome P450 [Pseudonocardia sp. GCM10023141]|uniref:cytochrome P450 n=1 Tax=Pseudonocardia sp. GCM10023141 TaxID=3252653 RepID=UPI00361176B2